MIIEDLFWKDDVAPMGLSSPHSGALTGEPLLQECEVCEVRCVGALGSVGIVFDARTGLWTETWSESLDVIVLIVRGVTRCSYGGCRDQIGSWEVDSGRDSWTCRIGLWHTPEKMEISGAAASLFGGVVPGLPDTQPMLGSAWVQEVRAGWPTWQSEFVLTTEPEHANPHLIPGRVGVDESGGSVHG